MNEQRSPDKDTLGIVLTALATLLAAVIDHCFKGE